MWAGGKGRTDGSRDMQEPFFFLKGTAFKPPRRVILVSTPTEGDGPACGPIGASSQTWRVCFVGGCQELHRSFFYFFPSVKTRMSAKVGKLTVGSDSSLAGAGRAKGLLDFGCLSSSHPWLDPWHIPSCSPPGPPVWVKKKQHHSAASSLNTRIYSRSRTFP